MESVMDAAPLGTLVLFLVCGCLEGGGSSSLTLENILRSLGPGYGLCLWGWTTEGGWSRSEEFLWDLAPLCLYFLIVPSAFKLGVLKLLVCTCWLCVCLCVQDLFGRCEYRVYGYLLNLVIFIERNALHFKDTECTGTYLSKYLILCLCKVIDDFAINTWNKKDLVVALRISWFWNDDMGKWCFETSTLATW